MEYRDQLKEIRRDFLFGAITDQQARELAQPIIDKMNERAKEVAKEFGKRHKPFTYSYLMR